MAAISSDSPLLEIASTRSAAVIMPRSPWLASAGCTNMAGVPVDASVAAILRPIWPLLPMPITTTRPRDRQHQLHGSGQTRPHPALEAQNGRGLDVEGLAAPERKARSAEVGDSRRWRGRHARIL